MSTRFHVLRASRQDGWLVVEIDSFPVGACLVVNRLLIEAINCD